jgi:hypothetical protein
MEGDNAFVCMLGSTSDIHHDSELAVAPLSAALVLFFFSIFNPIMRSIPVCKKHPND